MSSIFEVCEWKSCGGTSKPRPGISARKDCRKSISGACWRLYRDAGRSKRGECARWARGGRAVDVGRLYLFTCLSSSPAVSSTSNATKPHMRFTNYKSFCYNLLHYYTFETYFITSLLYKSAATAQSFLNHTSQRPPCRLWSTMGAENTFLPS